LDPVQIQCGALTRPFLSVAFGKGSGYVRLVKHKLYPSGQEVWDGRVDGRSYCIENVCWLGPIARLGDYRLLQTIFGRLSHCPAPALFDGSVRPSLVYSVCQSSGSIRVSNVDYKIIVLNKQVVAHCFLKLLIRNLIYYLDCHSYSQLVIWGRQEKASGVELNNAATLYVLKYIF